MHVAPFLHGKDKHESICVEQSTPVKPLVQLHEKAFWRLLQTAPFLHGDDKLSKVKEVRRSINKLKFL